MNHVSVSPTDGNGPTQGQRKTLTRVGPHNLYCKWEKKGHKNRSHNATCFKVAFSYSRISVLKKVVDIKVQ